MSSEKINFRKLCKVLSFISLLLFVKCAVQQVSNTGTETGNPVIITCLKSAFDIFDTADKWLPSHYLVFGDEQLSANYLSNANDGKLLAKQTGSKDYDSIVTFDTIFFVDTLYDTVFQPHIIYVRDTSVKTYFKTDTIPASNGSKIFKTYLFSDTAFIIDTLYIKDTTFVKRVSMTDSIDTVVQAVKVVFADSTYSSIKEGWRETYDKMPDILQRPPVFSTCCKPLLKYDSTLYSLSRNAIVNENIINEVYIGNDSDSGLYTAPAGKVPAVSLNARYVNGQNVNISLDINFDAGFDCQFSTIGNNRITSLDRQSEQNNKVFEKISYYAENITPDHDTAILTIRRFSTDTVENITYYELNDSDNLDHNQNRLANVNKTIEFSNDSIKSIIITVSLDKPLKKAEIPESFQIEVSVDFKNGRTGVLSGRINMTDGLFAGVYAFNGIENYIYYNFFTDEIKKD